MSDTANDTPGDTKADNAGNADSNDNDAYTIGIILQGAREANGESIEDVARTLRINWRFLKALEEGQFDELPGMVYVIGFIRTYADYLGVDSEGLVDQYKALNSAQRANSHLTFPEPIPESGLPSGAIMFAGIVVAILAYGGWYLATEENSFLARMVAPVPEEMSGVSDSDESGAPDAPDEAVMTQPVVAEVTDVVEQTVETPEEMSEVAPKTMVEEGAEEVAPEPAPEMAVEPEPEIVAEIAPEAEPVAEVVEELAVESAGDVAEDVAEQVTEQTVEEVTEQVAEQVTEDVTEEADAQSLNEEQLQAAQEALSDEPQSASEEVVEAIVEEVAEAAPENTPEEAPAEEAASVETPVEVVEEAAVKIVEEEAVEAAQAPVEQASVEQVAVTETVAGSRVYGEPDGARIIVRAKVDSWIQVRDDASGALLLTRMLRAGDEYHVPDRKDLSLLTGNAGGLEILVDGTVAPPIGATGDVRRDVPLDADSLLSGNEAN